MRARSRFLLLSLLLAFPACTVHTIIEPAPKARFVPNLGLGGPIVEAFDMHIPVPYLTAGGDYGISDEVSLHGNLHVLPLAYAIGGLDLGVFWFPVAAQGLRPTLGVGPRVFAFVSTRGGVSDRFMGFPAVSFSAAWPAGAGRIYAGGDLAVLPSERDYDDDPHGVLFSPFVGYRWDAGTRISLFAELKVQGANVVSNRLVTGYIGIGDHGALTPLFGIQRRIGR